MFVDAALIIELKIQKKFSLARKEVGYLYLPNFGFVVHSL